MISLSRKIGIASQPEEVDSLGQKLCADYNGKRYTQIQVNKPFSFIERSVRALFGTAFTILTLGTALLSSKVRSLFSLEKRSFKAGIRVKKPRLEPTLPQISFKKEKKCEKEKEKELNEDESDQFSPLESLSPEVAGLIFQQLPNDDVFSVERASKKCLNSVLANNLWGYQGSEKELKLNWSFAGNAHDPVRVNLALNKIIFEYLKMRIEPEFSYFEYLNMGMEKDFSNSAFVHSIKKHFEKYSILKDFPAFNYFFEQESRFFRNKKMIRNIEIENEIWKKSLDPKNSGECLLHILFKNFEFYKQNKNSRIKYDARVHFHNFREHSNYLFNNLKKLIENGHSTVSLYAFHILLSKEQRFVLAKLALDKQDFKAMEIYLQFYQEEVEKLYNSEADCSPPVILAYAEKLYHQDKLDEACEVYEKGFLGYGSNIINYKNLVSMQKSKLFLLLREKFLNCLKVKN